MSCCNTYLGKFPHSGNVPLNQIAQKTGEYSFLINFLDSKFIRKATFEIGDDLIIPGPWNENFTYELSVTDPDSEPIINIANMDCTIWHFTTFILTNETCNGTECDDTADSGDYDY